MEVEARGINMWLLGMPIKGFVITYFVAALLFAGSILIGGALGPDVWTRYVDTAWKCGTSSPIVFDPSNCTGVDLSVPGSVYQYTLSDMGQLNQEIDLYIKLSNLRADTGIERDVYFNISIIGANEPGNWESVTKDTLTHRVISCDRGSYWCDRVILASVPFVHFTRYQYYISAYLTEEYFGDAEFTFEFVNASNTEFELWWRFTFLGLTFFAICLFSWFIRKLKLPNWAIEQKWTSILLFALVGYNNPAFPLFLLFDGWFPIFINQVLTTIFYAVLLLYWLVTFDGIRKESQKMSALKFYLPKFIYVGVCWALIVLVLTWNQMHKIDDPTHSYTTDIGGYMFFAIGALILILIYVAWVGYVIFRAFVESSGALFLRTRIRFFGGFTIFVMILFSFLLVITFYSHPSIENNAAKFLTTIALANIYVWVLVVMFLPVKDAIENQDVRKDIAMTHIEGETHSEFPNEEFPAANTGDEESQKKKVQLNLKS
ncbi:transmembrane protein [Pelomyxa schiedti]|nr:transmembrane protein [Pelomyxa schiedti]